jgi:O-antigen ligase
LATGGLSLLSRSLKAVADAFGRRAILCPILAEPRNEQENRMASIGISTFQAQLKALVPPFPQNGIARNNAISAFLMGALPAVAGSIVAVMLYTFFVWAIISLALRRFEFRMTRNDRLLALSLTAFAVLIAATALFGKNPGQAPQSMVWLLAFLSPWALIPRLRASPEVDYLGFYITGAALGAIGACIVAFVQLAAFKIRPEGGAGNADVFAIISLCLMGLGGLNIGSPSGKTRMLGAAAAIAGALAIVLSMTRGVAVVAVPMIVLLAAFAPAIWRRMLSRPAVLLVIAAIGLVLFGVQRALDVRWEYTLQEIHLVLNDQHTGSIGERLRLWYASLEAIVQSPIWGYGIQNRMDSLVPTLRLDGYQIRNYTHAHNGFLTSMLDGGVLALAALIAMLRAPIALAWRGSEDDANYRIRLFVALAVCGTYVLCGMTQIMFKHDIMDSFFVFFSIVVAASIPDRAVDKP